MAAIEKETITTYTIPENFIDEGRIIRGMVKTKNFIEGLLLAGVAAIFTSRIEISEVTTKITVFITICGPFFMLGVGGFNGDSLFQTAANAVKWLKSRTVILYNGNARALTTSPLDSMMAQETPQDMIIEYVEGLKAARRKKRSAISYVEGENFVFHDDPDLVDIYADYSDEDELQSSGDEPVLGDHIRENDEQEEITISVQQSSVKLNAKELFK
jgi:hypothetical protein